MNNRAFRRAYARVWYASLNAGDGPAKYRDAIPANASKATRRTMKAAILAVFAIGNGPGRRGSRKGWWY